MRPSFTLALLLVALLVAYALYFIPPQTEHSAAATEQTAAQPLLRGDLGTADSLTITLPERELHFTRSRASWQVGAPVHDAVDPDRMASLLSALAGASILEEVQSSRMTKTAWALTGLEQPEIHLMVRAAGQPLCDAWIGRPGAVAHTNYLTQQTSSGTKRLLVQADLLPLLTLPPESWRDPSLITAPPGTISKLVIASQGSLIELTRDKPKAPWQITKPLRTKAKESQVTAMLTALSSLKVQEQRTDSLAELEAGTQRTQITLHSAQLAAPVDLTLVPDSTTEPSRLRATASHRHGSFIVTGEQTAALWYGINELRDDRLITTEPEKVEELQITGGAAGDITLRKLGGNWTMLQNGVWQDANSKRVERLFQQLQELTVLEFVTDSATSLGQYGLVKPYLSLRWAESSGEASPPSDPNATGFSASTSLGLQNELHIGLADGGNVYAKFEERPFVYRVPAVILDAFPRDKVRWKSLSPLRFSQFSLRRIALSVAAQPPIILDYDPVTAAWTCTRAGEDLSSQVDRSKADSLMTRLGDLVVSDWLQNRTDAAKALLSPSVTIGISLLSEAGNLSSPLSQHTYRLAPTQDMQNSAFFYGRLDNSPDVFIISRAELLDLVGRTVFRTASP